MSEQHLNDLDLLSLHSNIEIDLDEIVKRFPLAHARRLTFVDMHETKEEE